MNLLGFNISKQKEITEMKEDVKALTHFSQLQMIDQQTFDLVNSNTLESAAFTDNILIDLWKQVPEISTVLAQITDRAKNVPWGHFKIKDKEKFSKFQLVFNNFLQGKESHRGLIKFKDETIEPIFNSDVHRLLTNPNDLQSWAEMIKQLLDYWYVLGNSYLLKLGSFGFVPDELNVMFSQQTDVVIRKSYEQNPFQINNEESAIEFYTFENGFGKKFTYDPELILHMKAPTILYKDTAWRKGYSPLASAILASKTLKHEYLSRLSLVRDRGMMGALVGDNKGGTPPTVEDTKKIYERLKKFGLGDGKRNSYGVTNGSYKWLNMTFNSGELELLKGREENLKVLARKFNVPTDLLIGESTFNNINSNGKIIYTSNVMPWLNDLQNKLNPLIGLNEKGEAIMPIYDNIAELQQDLKVQTDIMTSQFADGIATREEARIGVGRTPEPTEGEFKDDKTNNKTEE